jgi:hypothetical protein
MLKVIGGILLLCVSGLAVMFYAVGNHGHLMFRLHMTEDWIIWGIALIAATTGIFLLIRSNPRKKTDKKWNET